uniref:Protein kinase domain-containing protein n=1 Tax=Haptolina ericina TaxID=156174 RepID=A0A7S3FBI3_9EUKA|mmetsp:Transcript_62909/g.140074  ORF Transcript_62909/g.140074 Transcript_62909/m.140074 type:complete len:449 (+) Transcript_62909:42-1388(+)
MSPLNMFSRLKNRKSSATASQHGSLPPIDKPMPSQCVSSPPVLPAATMHVKQSLQPAAVMQPKPATAAAPKPGSTDTVRSVVVHAKKLGSGAYGAVHLGTCYSTDGSVHCVAVKVISAERMRLESLSREASILKRLSRAGHPSAVRFYGWFSPGSKKVSTDATGPELTNLEVSHCLVMDRLSGGELFEYVLARKGLSEREAAPFLRQIAEGLAHAHSLGVAHRDLKLENVLISASPSGDDICKVCDFGLAYRYEVDGSGKVLKGRPLTETCGSKSYAAPEVLEGRGYDGFDADVWSCGICLFAMLAGFFPLDEATGADWRFERVKLATQHRQSATRTIFSFYDRPCQLSSQVVDMIDGMILVQPNRRLKTEDVLQSMWVIDDTIKADYADEYMYDEAPRYRGQAGSFDPNAVSGYGGQQDMAPLYRGAPAGVIAAPPPLMKQLAVLGQ